MDNNSLIFGKISTSGGGITKTYEESRFVFIQDKSHQAYCLKNNCEFYLNVKTNEITPDKNEEDTYKEMVILSILPYGGASQHGGLYYDFIVEVIEKDILRAHLYDERMIMEELLKNSQNALTLK